MAETKQENATKSKEELEAEQVAAKEQINLLLNQSRPKHLGYGVTSGVSNIVQGAVGGVGLAVMAPTVGLAQGAKQGGIVGGTVGLLGGAVVGVVGGAAVALSGEYLAKRCVLYSHMYLRLVIHIIALTSMVQVLLWE